MLALSLATAKVDVCWEVNLAREAICRCARRPPTVLTISPTFADLSGVELANAIRRENAGVRILVFAGEIHRDLIEEMLAAPVQGIVCAASPLPILLTAIGILMNGGCYYDGLTEALLHGPRSGAPTDLTARERLVLRLVAEGFSTKEIASQLSISSKTADKFRARIMQKLDLHDAVRLTRYAIRHGICSLN